MKFNKLDLDLCCDKILLIFNDLKQLPEHSRYYAWILGRSVHGVRFAASSLTVGKYGKIKAVESALHQFFDIFRNFLL
jgi:hypothetical protein